MSDPEKNYHKGDQVRSSYLAQYGITLSGFIFTEANTAKLFDG